jgi:hypothetical protein
MAIIEQLQHNPFDDSDYPDDYRPNSTWAIACDPSNVEGSYAADLAVAVEVVAPGDRVPCTRTPSTSSSSWRMGWPKSNSAPRPELFSPARSSLFRQERHTLAVRWAIPASGSWGSSHRPGSESRCSTEIRRRERKAIRRSRPTRGTSVRSSNPETEPFRCPPRSMTASAHRQALRCPPETLVGLAREA